MTESDAEIAALLMLGEDYCQYGAFGSSRVGEHAAAGISVGVDLESPSHQFKHDPDVPNEDALCVVETPTWAGYAVADAHFGPESSHVLLSRLQSIWTKIRPTDLDHLGQMVEFLRTGDRPQTESETSLLVVFYDRVERRGFGLSFGDSTFAVAGPRRLPTPLNQRNTRYASGHHPSSLRSGEPFWFEAEPGEVLLLYTDGIDECHYRRPATSIGPAHIAAVIAESGGDPLVIVDSLVDLALTGVDGNPGGQDNIALVVALA